MQQSERYLETRQAAWARLGEFAAALRAKMIELGHNWPKEPDLSHHMMNGARIDGVHVYLVIKEQGSLHGMFDWRSNGRLRCTVGDWPQGRTRNFPEPKNGFDVDKIAGVLSAVVTRRTEEDEHRNHLEKLRGESSMVATEINSRLGLLHGAPVRAGVHPDTGRLALIACAEASPELIEKMIRMFDRGEA